MKKIVVFFFVLALFVPNMAVASSRHFHDGFHRTLGAATAVAVVVVGANILHGITAPQPAYAQPYYPPQQYNRPRGMSEYEYAYARETMRLQRETEMRARQFEREQAIRDARRDYGYYR